MKSSKVRALVLVGHGSPEKGFDAPMKKMAAQFSKDSDFGQVRCAYLGSTSPSIYEAIEQCVQRGAMDIKVFPYFLLKGKHVTTDIPTEVSKAKRAFKSRITLCPYFGYDKLLFLVIKKRIHASG